MRSLLGWTGAFGDLFESRTFVHGHVVGFVALDQILRLFLGGTDGVGFEFDGGGDSFLDRSSDAARFRVPLHMIPSSEFVFHRHYLLHVFLLSSGMVGQICQPFGCSVWISLVSPHRHGFRHRHLVGIWTFLLDELQRALANILHCETILAHQKLPRGGRAEAIHSNHITPVAHMLAPTLSRACFNRESRPHGWRKNRVAILLRLDLEQLPAWHGYDSDADPVFGQSLAG